MKNLIAYDVFNYFCGYFLNFLGCGKQGVGYRIKVVECKKVVIWSRKY